MIIVRPSKGVPSRDRHPRKRSNRLEELIARYEEGQDLWTGNYLTGSDKASWVMLALGLGEDEAEGCLT